MEKVRAYGDGILELQNADGSFCVQINGPRVADYRPGGIMHWSFAENVYKAMSEEGYVSLEINAVSALQYQALLLRDGLGTTSWVDAHVEWEVIEILSVSRELGIDWAVVDPEIDWHRYEEGIACAMTYWMLDSGRAEELPLDEDLGMGNLDGMFADQHDPVTDEHLGWQLFPDHYANIIMNVLERKE